MSATQLSALDDWLKHAGPVAFIIKQQLTPVDEEELVVFPPTYPVKRSRGRTHSVREGEYRVTVEMPPETKDGKSESTGEQEPGYNIDRFGDGTNICEIDSPQSQSNRIEPRFKEIADGKLVPKIEIAVGNETVNLLDVGHRAADAVVRMSSLAAELHDAFTEAKSGNFFELAKYAPTSLVFGVWDSRSTYVKVQRAVKAHIRATNVRELTKSAQYTPAVNYVEAGAVAADVESGKKEDDNNLSQEGMKHALSTQIVGGVELTDSSTLIRTVNVNVAAIRTLKGNNKEQTKALQRYILSLALVAALDEPELNLREGCNLRFRPCDNNEAEKATVVYRKSNGKELPSDFDAIDYAMKAYAGFIQAAGEDWTAEKANRTDLQFEKGVAENFLGRKKDDRKKISQLGPITQETLMRFDAKGKDPFKVASDLLKEAKKAIGRKPAKTKPRKQDISAFTEVANELEAMSGDESLPDGVADVARELLDIACKHDDSHAAEEQIRTRIKECKDAMKAGTFGSVQDSNEAAE